VGNQDNIYTFKEVKFKTGSRDWCVSSITFNLQATSIPQIIIKVDPVHKPGDPNIPATLTSLESLADWHKQAQKFAIDKEPASLSFKVYKKSELEQEIDLKDWITSDAGLVLRGMEFSLEITIQHPIVKTALSGMNLGSFAETVGHDGGDVIGTNVLEAYIDSLTKYTEAEIDDTVSQEVPGSMHPAPAEMFEAMKQRLREALQALQEHAEWAPGYYDGCTYTDWPQTGAGGPLAEWVDLFPGIVSGVVSGMLDNTVWEVFASEVMSQFGLVLVPTYWEEKLKLVPFTPWAKHKYELRDNEISTLVLPGFEKTTLAGVTVNIRLPAGGGDHTVYNDVKQGQEFFVDELVYMPDDTLVGSYTSVDLPAWLYNFSSFTAADSGQYTAFGNAEGENRVVTPGSTAPEQAPVVEDGGIYQAWMEEYQGAAYAFAHQHYLATVRSTLQVSVRTKLLIKKEGEWLTPGNVFRIITRGKRVFDFYATSILHVIDVERADVYTEINGAWPRPSFPPQPGVSPDDEDGHICNPFWT